MTAQVSECKAFRSYDGEVFDTFLKAHYHNIDYFVDKLFGDDDDYECDSSGMRARIKIRLKNKSRPNGAEDAILKLAEELK